MLMRRAWGCLEDCARNAGRPAAAAILTRLVRYWHGYLVHLRDSKLRFSSQHALLISSSPPPLALNTCTQHLYKGLYYSPPASTFSHRQAAASAARDRVALFVCVVERPLTGCMCVWWWRMCGGARSDTLTDTFTDTLTDTLTRPSLNSSHLHCA